jgi:hypothetical protein
VGRCFEQKHIFPAIQEAIERLCNQRGEAKHEAIIDELLEDSEASAVVDQAILRCPEFKRRAMVGLMIAWFSQRYSVHPKVLVIFLIGSDRRSRAELGRTSFVRHQKLPRA